MVEVGYTDNAFRESGDAVGDGFIQANPSMRVNVVGIPHDVGFRLGVQARQQFRRSRNDFVDFNALGNSQINITKHTQVDTLAYIRRGHERRSSLDTAGSRGSLPKFIHAGGGMGFTVDRPGGFVSLGQTVTHKRFVSDPAGLAAGRDQLTYTTKGCAGRKFAQRLGVVLTVEGSYVDRLPSEHGIDAADNYNVSSLASLVYGLTGVTQLHFGAGWLVADTLNTEGGVTNTFALRGGLRWEPTDLTAIVANLSTQIQQTAIGERGTLLRRHQRVGVRHDVLPFVNLTADLNYTVDDVQFSDAAARTLWGQLGATYSFHQNAQIGARYRYTRRFGSGNQTEFVSNTFLVSLTAVY